MLTVHYTFKDGDEMQLFLDTIINFLFLYTEHKFDYSHTNDRVIFTLWDFSCAFDALQLIHTFDTIISNKDILCTLEEIHFVEH